MNQQPMLSDEEWGLVMDLLERELGELPIEIHHTRSAELRHELARRRDVLRDLLARLRNAAEPAYA